MKKLFYIEQDQILRATFEALTKDSSWDLYTLESMDDFDFRFKDFTPDLLLVDVTLCNKAVEVHTQIPVVYIGFSQDFEGKDFCSLKVEKPIEVTQILSRLESYL